MPFRSKLQSRWMFANHPKMAKEWAAETDYSHLIEKKKPAKKDDEPEHYPIHKRKK